MKLSILLFFLFQSLCYSAAVCGHCNIDFPLPSQNFCAPEHLNIKDYPEEKLFKDEKFGEILIKKLSNSNGLPAFSILSKHYDFYLEGENLDPLDTAKLLEAAWKVKKEFFQACPPESERMRIEMYDNREGYYSALNRDNLGQIDSGGYYWEGNKKAYLWWQSAGIEFSRYLLLHEAAHQFEHLCNKKARVAKFWVEGIADFLGMHHWNGKSIKLGASMNSHLLRDKAANALQTYENLNNNFADILQRNSYNYDESWGIVHFLMHQNKEKGRRLFNNMLKSNSLEDSWEKTFKSKELQQDFHAEFIKWLTKMKECPKDIFFVSWGDIWFGWEKVNELKKFLRKKCPEELNVLIEEMESLAEKGTSSNKMKTTFMRKAPNVLTALILNDIPSYRLKTALNSFTESEEEIENLKKNCLNLALELQNKNKQKEALKVFKSLAVLEVKDAKVMVDTYNELLDSEKKKALTLLKERKFYEAFRIYEKLCSIFPKSKDLGIYKIKEKLLQSENSKADINSALEYLDIFKKLRSGKSSKEQLKKDCQNYLNTYKSSRFKSKVQDILDKLNRQP